jgi:hypothetical protein
MRRCAVVVRTDVSEECIASVIRVRKIGELGTMVAVTSNLPTLRRNSTFLTAVEPQILQV